MAKKEIKKQKSVSVKFKDETKVHPALREYFGYCLFKASARLRLIMDKTLESHKIQTHHLGILKLLKVSGAISQIAIGDELGIDKASMVKLIDHLEKSKYVTRQIDARDRRIKKIFLTEKGFHVLNQCEPLKVQVEKEFFHNLSASEQEFIKKLVPQLLP